MSEKPCARCKTDPRREGDCYCRPCRNMVSSLSMKRRRDIAKAEGLCVECRKRKARRGIVSCSMCSKKTKINGEKLARERAASGLCVRCGLRDPGGTRKRCEPCLAEARKAARRSYLGLRSSDEEGASRLKRAMRILDLGGLAP